MEHGPSSLETVTRFLTQTDHFSRESARVKERSFLPPPDGRLSVYHIDELLEDQVWLLCQRNPCYGRGDLLANSVSKVGLTIDPDNDTPRHASIIGWPSEKPQRKSLAQKLAAEATFKSRPSAP
jgi:hypothetical protein